MTLRDVLVRLGFLMVTSGGILAVWALVAGVHRQPELPEEPDDDDHDDTPGEATGGP